LFPVLWVELYGDTEDLSVERIVQMNVMNPFSPLCFLARAKKYRKTVILLQTLPSLHPPSLGVSNAVIGEQGLSLLFANYLYTRSSACPADRHTPLPPGPLLAPGSSAAPAGTQPSGAAGRCRQQTRGQRQGPNRRRGPGAA